MSTIDAERTKSVKLREKKRTNLRGKNAEKNKRSSKSKRVVTANIVKRESFELWL